MKIIKALFLLMLLLAACVSEETDRSMNDIATELGAENAFIRFNKVIELNKESVPVLELHLINPSIIDSEYSISNIGSVSAKMLLDGMTEAETNSYKMIKIVVSKDSSSEEVIYKIEDLRSIDKDIEVVSKYFEYAKNRDNRLLEKISNGNSAADFFQNITLQVDSLFGESEGIKVFGFNFKELENDDTPVSVIWVQSKHNMELLSYQFIVKRKNHKIIKIDVTEE